MTTTALTFLSRRCRHNAAGEHGDDETRAGFVSADAGTGIFLGDKSLLRPLPVSPWLWRAVAVEKLTSLHSVGNQLFPRVLVSDASLSGEDDVRLLFPVEQLLLKT